MTSAANDSDAIPDETVLEFVIRERLTKEDVVSLSVSLGGPRQGSRDELAEKLLVIRGLKAAAVLEKLPTEDLDLVIRRFGIPASQSSGVSSLISGFLGEDRATKIKRIEKFASKERPPRSRIQPKGAPAPAERQPLPPTSGPSRVVETSLPTPSVAPQPVQPSAAAVTGLGMSVVTAPSAPPTFEAVSAFIHDYEFAFRWKDEQDYEAELLGALRGFFGRGHVIRQQAESGRRYDIVVRNAARVEMKVPETKADLDRMNGQVERYLAAGGLGVIVVLCGNAMKNQQDVHDSQTLLTGKGARVFLKG